MIFGIGLPKTGTTSLTQALTALTDKRFIHSDPSVNERLHQAIMENTSIPRAFPAGAGGGTEMPALREMYMDISDRLPAAKFIMTTRDMADWLESMKAHRDRNNHRRLWDTFQGTDRQMLTDFILHHRTAMTYFNFSDRFLMIDLIEGTDQENWAKLAAFLDVEPPQGRKFPHKNSTAVKK